MKQTLLKLLPALLLFAGLNADAQITPSPSSSQTVIQSLGLGQITLTYARPNVKGRKIFGGMEPYGAVWRTGANAATLLKFSSEVIINGTRVPAGEYGLFTIPTPTEWTIILSKQPKQWGAYTYKAADDFLRFKVKNDKLKELTETMTLSFINVTPTAADLQMKWEKSSFTFHIVSDIDAKVMTKIDSAMKTDKKPYYEAVIYYYNNGKDLNKAVTWANELDNVKNFPLFVAKLWQARTRLKTGDKAGAIKAAQEGVEVAKKANNDEYVRLNTEVLVQAKK